MKGVETVIRYIVISILSVFLLMIFYFSDKVTESNYIGKIIELQLRDDRDRVVIDCLNAETMVIVPPNTIAEDLMNVVPEKYMVKSIMNNQFNSNNYQLFMFSFGNLQNYERLSIEYVTKDWKPLVITKPYRLVVQKTSSVLRPYKLIKEKSKYYSSGCGNREWETSLE